MKPTSPYATLRAFGVGTVAGCVGAAVLALAFKYLGAVGFYGVCLVVGAGSWGLAEFLDRRARRAQQRHGGAAVVTAHRMDGFFGVGSIVMAAGIALMVIAMTHTPDAPPAAQQPAPVSGVGIAYAPYIFADYDTGCQYLSTHTSTGLAPRIAADGKTHMGCKGTVK